MTNERQRQQWADHMRDEADAIDAQRASAGGRHEPQEKPLPFSRNDMSDAGEAASFGERRRCAQIAMAFASEAVLREQFPDWTAQQLRDVVLLATRIAQAIEGSGLPGSEEQT